MELHAVIKELEKEGVDVGKFLKLLHNNVSKEKENNEKKEKSSNKKKAVAQNNNNKMKGDKKKKEKEENKFGIYQCAGEKKNGESCGNSVLCSYHENDDELMEEYIEFRDEKKTTTAEKCLSTNTTTGKPCQRKCSKGHDRCAILGH